MQEADKCVLGGIAIITAILMTTNDASAEAMIDRGAKPYFIAGGVIATAFFISVGAMLIRKASRYLRLAAAAAQWPVVAGKVISVEIVERIDKTEDGPSRVFVPQVHYVYNADGVSRDGSSHPVWFGKSRLLARATGSRIPRQVFSRFKS
jgi:hypothetical protein